jgi:D-alanyl-D-alanine carboxypeptidase (penicillin-binding protein 5/6)
MSRTTGRCIVLFLVGFLFCLSGMGEARKRAKRATKKVEPPAAVKQPAPGSNPALPFDVSAEAAVLMDAATGTFLYEKNPDERLIPASLTKVMTLYLAFDALKAGRIKPDEEEIISEKAWKMGGSQMFIEVGQRVKFDDLLKGIAVVSGNDACVAVAEALAGSEAVFVQQMNDKARELGLENTHFMNPDGLPADGHYSTARDLAVLSFNYLKDHPEALAYHSMKELTYGKIKQYNRNGLLFKDNSVDGLKTGWVRESGFHIIATAKRGSQRYIAVVMGEKKEKQREADAWTLLLYGFKNFSTVRYAKKGERVGQVKVWKGMKDSVPVEMAADGMMTLPRTREKSLTTANQLPDSVYAPVGKGEIVGTMSVMLDGKKEKEVSLVAAEEVAQAGIGKRFIQSFVLFTFYPPYIGAIVIAVAVVLAVVVLFLAVRRSEGI